MAVPHGRQNADDEQHAADERGQSAAKFHSCADAVADKKQHERQQIHEHGKTKHLPGLALEQHTVADGRVRVIACGNVKRLGFQTAATAALGTVVTARRAARYLDLCQTVRQQLFDGSLLGHGEIFLSIIQNQLQ